MITDSFDRMFSVHEVAEVLHVHPNTLRRWSDEGLIMSYRITARGDRRYCREDIKEFLKKMNDKNTLPIMFRDRIRL